MRRIVDNHWFALTDLLLVMMSAVAWMVIPQFGITISLIAFLPWLIRSLSGHFPFQRTPFDWLIGIFLLTAWVGYWVAYDRPAAEVKYWLIVSAVLLYYALSAQPRQNLGLLSFLSFCFASFIALYFFLTYDFRNIPIGVITWWTTHRPQLDWPALHHGNTSGLLLISSIFALYWLWGLRRKSDGAVSLVQLFLLILIGGLICLTFLLAISHGIELIVLAAVGFGILWKVSTSARYIAGGKTLFPILVLAYLAILVIFVYIGPAKEPAGQEPNDYGINSRTELVERGVYFLIDYPITGAGLNSFPGLYSQYMIVIPFFYFINSYNLFLDIGVEQGLVGGVVFLIIYLSAIWLVSRRIITAVSRESRMVNWISLLALLVMMVYGLFYDNLYHNNGTALLFYPLGMAMIGVRSRNHPRDEANQLHKEFPRLNLVVLALPVLVLILMFGIKINKLTSYWYANLGAVEMSQVELKNFPSDQWATSDMAHGLEPAESKLQTALQYDPQNQTANYRLGLISMLRQDFITAVTYLETAYQAAPNHRGIIKSLGYTYVWLGDIDKARALLAQIPEAQREMEVYIWWWETQGRPDLSERASQITAYLDPASQQ